MIHLHARKRIPVHEYLNSLNIIPISISYEKDPNDITKTNELYLTNLNKKYTKEPKEDLKSIAEGIRGQKGDVNLHIGSVMEFTTDSYEDCSDQITTEIKRSYKLHATNYAAALMQGKKVTIDSFNENQIDDAFQYLNRRMSLISEEMQPYFLNQYSNPTNV
jgi:hypothetical protein